MSGRCWATARLLRVSIALRSPSAAHSPPVELARSHCLRGMAFGAEGRRIDGGAVEPLARFRRDRSNRVTDRAARELAATAETFRKLPSNGGLGSKLTVREAQIAPPGRRRPVEPGDRRATVISHRPSAITSAGSSPKLDVANRAQLHHAQDRARSCRPAGQASPSFDQTRRRCRARTVAVDEIDQRGGC